MKKNKVMRLASCLLVAVLFTTCMISGTFAKYVTSVDIKDNGSSNGDGAGSSATVAKFEIKLNDEDITKGGTKEFNFGLFDKILDTKDETDWVVANGTPEDDVVAGLIAPGTWGGTDNSTDAEGTKGVGFILYNNSEVTVEYTISMEFKTSIGGATGSVTTNDLPLEFSLDGGKTWSAATASPDEDGETVVLSASMTGILKSGENTKLAKYGEDENVGDGNLLWRWAFTDATDAASMAARDAIDTEIGIAAAAVANATAAGVKAEFDFVLHIVVEQVD